MAIMGYGPSDAAAGTLLALRAVPQIAGAPRPPSGTPVVFLQVEVSGSRVVTFENRASESGVRSPLLQPVHEYTVYSFAGGQPVGVPLSAGKPINGGVTFISPLADLSLAPGIPLVVEVVADARITEAAPLSASSELWSEGSTVALPLSGLSGGSVDYSANDAPARTTLTLMNSGARNFTNAITPTGYRAALFVQVWVSGTRAVTFGPSPGGALLASGVTPEFAVRDPLLLSGVRYQAYVFVGGRLSVLGKPNVAAPDGTVSFRSPLVNTSMSPLLPVVIELVPLSWRGIRTVTAATPRPTATPAGAAWNVADGVGFNVAPPGAKPVNKIRASHLRGAKKSYVWRHRGNKRVLYQFATAIQHVVVIIMENRTPDDLFSAYYGFQFPPDAVGTTFGEAIDLANPSASPMVTSNPLEARFDPAHGHLDGFIQEAANGTPYRVKCDPTAGCPTGDSVFSFVPLTSTSPLNSEVQNYITLIENYAYGSHVMQWNEGPSFISHQYAIAGQSGGVINWFGTSPTPTPTPTLNPYAMVENPQNTTGGGDPSDPDPDAFPGGGSCVDQSVKIVLTVDMTTPYPGIETTPQDKPCNDYLTILDETQAALGTPYYDDWQYIAEDEKIIWSGPMAVQHLYNAYSADPNPQKTGQPFAADPDAQNFVASLAGSGSPQRPFAALTYITPCQDESDHPEFGGLAHYGPQWLAWLINAIGTSNSGSNWDHTAIIVTWDDWGGWYDHYEPFALDPGPPPEFNLIHPADNAYSNAQDPNEWGFRVPFIVVSPYSFNGPGTVSTKLRSQGALLNFAEDVFSLRSMGTDDAANRNTDGSLDVLNDMIDFNNPPATFNALPSPSWTPNSPGSCPSHSS